MGSQRSTSSNPNDALDPVDVSRRRGVDVNSDSNDSTESAESKENQLLTFTPEAGVQAPLFSEETANLESENNLDFRPESGSQRRNSGILRSETVPYIDQSGANPTFFLLKESESNDQPAPEIEIVQGTSLQISDESGNIIADSSDRSSGSRINRDLTTGNITSITYPDGKERNFTYTDGMLTGIETRERSKDGKISETRLVKENGQWFADLNGVKAALPGDVKLSKYGVLSLSMDGESKWRQERPDGKVLIEEAIATGAHLAYDSDNNIRQVQRNNNSSLELNYKDGLLIEVVEVDRNGNKITWKKSGDKWLSDANPPGKRFKMGIFPNGNLAFTEENGVKKVITSTGSEVAVRPDGSTYEFDRQGRFTAVKHSKGLEVKDLRYTEDGLLTNVQMTGRDGKSLNFERNGRQNSWKLTEISGDQRTVKERDWKGDIKISDDGTYSYRDDNASAKNDQGLWTVYKPDGTKVHVKENPDGSKATLDLDKNILNIERTNGTSLDVTYTNGHITEFTTTEPNGDTVKYVYDSKSGLFKPDKPGYGNIAEIYTRQDGSVEMFDETGTRIQINLDGSKSIENKNGSTAKINAAGQVVSTTSMDGEVERSFRYGADGSLRSAHETRKTEDKVENKEISGNNISVSEKGTIKFTDSTGKRVSTTADGSWQTLDDKGRILSVSEGNQTREFVRDTAGEVVKIVDSKSVSGVSRSEVWTREGNGNTFVKLDKEGNVAERREVKVLDDGSYRYIDEAGKEKFARVGYRGLDSGFSGSVEEARERLTELMEGHLDEPRKQRLEIIFDRYEKRAENRIEAQVAAGQDPEKCRQEWDEKVTKSYDNLAKMLDPNVPNAVYDIGVRAKLVESMAFSLACPVKANDQGNWGCCWMISGVFCGIIQHPDKMTDMLQQLSNTGTYTDLEGKTWTPPKGLLSITDQGGRWTIDNCGGGHRSPVSEILTSVAAYLSEDGRRTDRGSRGGTPTAMNHAMKKITGDTWTVTSEQSMVTPKMQKELLEKGGYVCIYPGHMYLAALEKHGEEWVVCASLQHGDGGRRINGTVSDLKTWNITGGRRRYNPDINLPECQDSPTGPIGNNWPGGGGARDWPFPGPFRPDPWPLLDRFPFIFRLYDETTRRKEIEREKEKEEEIKKKEQERVELERELAEKRAEERRIHKEEKLLEKKLEEDRERKQKQDEEARKKAEEIKKKQRMAFLKHEERYKKLMATNQARAIESSGEFSRRSRQENKQRPTSLSGQFLDRSQTGRFAQSASNGGNESTTMPSSINGFKLAHRPGASEMSNRIELVSPFQETSPELKSTLARENIPVTSTNLNSPNWINGIELVQRPGDSSIDKRLELISPLSETSGELIANIDKETAPKAEES